RLDHAEFGSPPMSSFRPLVTALLGRFFSVVALMADGSFLVDILMASVFLDPEIACAPPAVSRASRMPAAPAIPGGLCAAHFPGLRLMVLVPAVREWVWCGVLCLCLPPPPVFNANDVR